MIYHIFYDSNKDIAWSSTAGITESIIEEQEEAHGYIYLQADCDETPVGEKYYINEDGDDVLEKASFSPSFSDVNPDLDDVITVTGLPEGTIVYLDTVFMGTMEDTALTFTVMEAGVFQVVFKKDKHYDYQQSIVVKRYGE